ncbi:MAG: hypothetical protein MJY68_03475 [Bacteroidaceae bacterium]|nr:hypothetical protein [Bacteroidaceae bacterium]
MSIRTNILGYPRVGANRELKKAEEAYWAGKISREELLDRLLPVYIEILRQLEDLGAEYVQIDEPFLNTDISDEVRAAYRRL